MAEATVKNYRVVFAGVGAFGKDEIITAEQAGAQLERLLNMGALIEVATPEAIDREPPTDAAPGPKGARPQAITKPDSADKKADTP